MRNQQKSKLSKFTKTGITLAMAGALIVGAGVTSAQAFSTGGRACPGGASITGFYFPNEGARSTEFLDCGLAQVRIGYRVPGGPTLLTNYSSANFTVFRDNPGGQVYSNHRGTSQTSGFFTLQ